MLINLTKSSYSIFKQICQEKVDEYTDLLSDISSRRHSVYILLIKYKELINTHVDFDILSAYDNNNYSNKSLLNKLSNLSLQVSSFKENTLLINYLRTFRHYCIREKNLSSIVNLYTLYGDIPEKIYNKWLNDYNTGIMKHMFYNGSSTISYKVGTLHIEYKNRDFNKRKIDWNESLTLLKSIIKEENKELYDKYIAKSITKKEFINLAKPFVYNKDTNPNGKKWLLSRTDDGSVWINWSKPTNLPNYNLYSFTPTNFIHTPKRSQTEFLENVKSEEEIIESDLLGNRDKLNILYRFNPNFILNK